MLCKNLKNKSLKFYTKLNENIQALNFRIILVDYKLS